MKPEKKIYNAFLELKQHKLYYNQIKEYTKLSHSSLQNVLKKLTSSKILEEEKTKSNTFYKIKDKKLVALKFSEIAITKFNQLNPNIKNPLNHFLKNLTDEIYTIILFGSSSRKEETNKSDIDILVITNTKINLSKNKKQAELTSKHPLSLFIASIQQLKENKDDIIIQAKKTGFPIHKEQNFYEVILNEHN
ncbi:MAG: nucleotidyltransferase domain-containing protein [Candidatus Woesearchaeota archaeon]